MHSTTIYDLAKDPHRIYVGTMHGIDVIIHTNGNAILLNGAPRPDTVDPWAMSVRRKDRSFRPTLFPHEYEALLITRDQSAELIEYAVAALQLIPIS
jgi:hypothetical protein